MDNLERFVESISIDNKLIKEADTSSLKESINSLPQKITEAVDKENPRGWWVPISKYTKNGNGRIYNKRLWENVAEDQKDTWYGSPMLCNHPEDDGDPKNVCGVWLDIKVGDDMVYGLLIPSGRLGEDLKDHLHNGLRIGTSSSGFGRIMNDGVTVDPDTFQIERLSDWVLNPSQGTFFSYDENSENNNHIINSSNDLRESTKSSSLEEAKDNIYKENIVKDSAKFAKLEEKKFRRDMESFLEEATAITDPQERLQEFKEIKSYLEDGACPDLREKIEQKIAEEEAYIKTAIKEKAEFKEKFDVDSPRDLEEKITKIVEESESYNKEAQDWKGVAEKLQNILNEKNAELETRPTSKFVEYLNNKIESLEKEIKSYKAKFYEFAKKASDEAKEIKESKVSVSNSLNRALEEKKSLDYQLRKAQENLAAANALANKAVEDKKKLDESFRSLASNYNSLKAKYSDSNNRIIESNNKSDSLKKAYEAKIDNLNKKIEELSNTNRSLNSIIESQRKSLEECSAREIELNDKLSRQKETLKKISNEFREAQFRAYGKESETKKVQRSKSPIVNYYEGLYKNYGNAIIPFKERLLKAPTMAEAKQIFYKDVLPNLPDTLEVEEARLPESFYLSPEERAEKIGIKMDESVSASVDRILDHYKGWI